MSEASNPAEEPKPEEPKPEEPKIIVDDDWKEQVAKEKAEAEAQAAAPPVSDVPGADENTVAPQSQDADQLPPPPPASIEMLISLLFTQALGALGQVPNPVTGKADVNKPYAKHYIDTIEMLGEKTTGNLTDEEAQIISEALHALRMAYVNTRV